MFTDETKPGDFINKRSGDFVHINGWGIDADPNNDPTYPIKRRTDEEHAGYTWLRPPQQPETAEILKSVERPNLTAVYGTSMPPSGVSGMIRRLAYKYSESSYGRWLPLMLADRVNVVEGIFEDFSKGHIPNIAGEIGLASEWKHNRKNLILNIAAAAIITGIAVSMFRSARARRNAAD